MASQISETSTTVPDEISAAIVLPENYAHEMEVTYPAFDWLRENEPLGRGQVEGYDPMWFVTKNADILDIERNPEIFTNGIGEPRIQDKASLAFIQHVTGGQRAMDILSYMDAPEHTKIKTVTSKWFLPVNVRSREESVRALAGEAVEKFLSLDGECDFVQDFALYYPLRVVMSLFGVPPEDEPIMYKLTQDLLGNSEQAQPEDVPVDADAAGRRYTESIAEFSAYFSRLCASRRAHPTDDLASVIANATVDGELLADSFVNGYYIAIAGAGHDTTTSTIAGAMRVFAERPDQLQLVRNDLSLVPSMIEEAIRWVSPVKHFQRVVSRDHEFRGRQFREGDFVELFYPSGNRDEDVFEDPDVFDATRKPNKHVGFGFGPHLCLGQHVAKFEMRLLFEELLPRLASVELAGEPRTAPGNFITGLKNLPISFKKA